ncbi:MAG: cohesin domain-containing protein [Geobacteraceae bacterium]|nr:cohesin domain-containing protein [Geobacteraceae bacterium]
MKYARLLVSCTLALLLLLAALPDAPAAAANLSISPGGDGIYVLECSAVNEVETMDVTFRYDNSAMTIVSVREGSLVSGRGTLSSSGIGTGEVRVYVKYTPPVSGNGPIAIISYTPKPGSAGNVSSLRGTMINSDKESIPVAVSVRNPSQPDQQLAADKAAADKAAADKAAADKAAADKAAADKAAADKAAAGQAAAGQAAAEQPATRTPQVTQTTVIPSTPTGLPASISVGMPKDETSKASPESPVAPEASQGLASAEKSAAAEAATRAEAATDDKSPEVLERFRNYRGERSLQAFAALFKTTANSSITQEPRIVLSDGSAKATLLIKGHSTLKYSLQKAKRSSLKKTADNSWQLEVVPDKGTHTAAIMIRQGSSTVTFPLTVAPPAKVTDKDFPAYLSERAKGSTRFDLNKDGVTNYIDDYIFTANCLAARQHGAKGPGTK